MSMTKTDLKLEYPDIKHKHADDALFVQSACNLSGIVNSLSRIMSDLWEEAGQKNKGTDWVNNHPVVRLFAEQIMYLSSKTSWDDAYKLCSDIVRKFEEEKQCLENKN